jgi:hypothetical protein
LKVERILAGFGAGALEDNRVGRKSGRISTFTRAVTETVAIPPHTAHAVEERILSAFNRLQKLDRV